MKPEDDPLSYRDQCSRFLLYHGNRPAAALLDAIPRDVKMDRYGDGGVVAELEAEVGKLLGKPAVAFFPSGTMAQQAAMRVHADRSGCDARSAPRQVPTASSDGTAPQRSAAPPHQRPAPRAA